MSEYHWQKPIFILGNPRSGTSLLRLMLDSHPRITIPPESHFFLWLEKKYGIWNKEHLDDYLEDLFQSTKFETWLIEKDEIRLFLKSQKIEDYSQLNSLIYYFYSLKNKKEISFWGDKNSLWVEKLNEIKKYYPKAFYIHIIRDGRDVACSYKQLNSININSQYAPKLANQIEEIAVNWQENVECIADLFNSLDSKKTIQIKYEDLVRTPRATLQKVLNLMELDVTENQIQYYLKDKKDIEPEEFFGWKEKLTQPPDVTNIGKYEKELTKSEIDTFNRLANKNLTKYGYL